MATGREQRDPNKEQYWRKTIQQQQSSGQTVRAFCEQHQISEHNFHSWRREIRKRDQEQSATPCPASNDSPQTTFVPITLTSALSPGEPTLEIQLPNQITLRIVGAVDASLLASTLAVLREQP